MQDQGALLHAKRKKSGNGTDFFFSFKKKKEKKMFAQFQIPLFLPLKKGERREISGLCEHVKNCSSTQPPTGRHAKWKLSRNTYTLHASFVTSRCRFGMLSRCLSTKISAPELSRKFIKGALLVG